MKEVVADWKRKLTPLLGQCVRVSFGDLSLDTVLLDVQKGVQKNMINVPDKRQEGDKSYTPPTVFLSFRDGSLYFVAEDVRSVVIGMQGVQIKFDSYAVRIALL
jgi:hypothetical protein